MFKKFYAAEIQTPASASKNHTYIFYNTPLFADCQVIFALTGIFLKKFAAKAADFREKIDLFGRLHKKAGGFFSKKKKYGLMGK